jgi:hypothetical protein
MGIKFWRVGVKRLAEPAGRGEGKIRKSAKVNFALFSVCVLFS